LPKEEQAPWVRIKALGPKSSKIDIWRSRIMAGIRHKNAYWGPSVETIAAALGVDEVTAQELRGLIKGEIAPDSYPGVVAWIKECHNRPYLIEQVLQALNVVLGGYGVEGIRSRRAWSDFWHDTKFLYVNIGDSYANTIIFDTETERFKTGSVGDLLEGRAGASLV
jgi:hypothetical protein